MEILLFRSLETDQHVINDFSLKQPLIQWRRSRKTLKRLRETTELWGVLYLISEEEYSIPWKGKQRHWIDRSQQAAVGLQCPHSQSTASLHVHRAGLVSGSTQPACEPYRDDAPGIMAEQQTYPWQVNVCSYTWHHKGRKSASLNTACCCLSLTPTLPRPQGCGDHSSSKHSCLSLLPAGTPDFSKGRSLLLLLGKGAASERDSTAGTQLLNGSRPERPCDGRQGFADLTPDTSLGKADRVFLKAVHKLWLGGRQTNTFQKKRDEWNGPNIKKPHHFSVLSS